MKLSCGSGAVVAVDVVDLRPVNVSQLVELSENMMYRRIAGGRSVHGHGEDVTARLKNSEKLGRSSNILQWRKTRNPDARNAQRIR